MPKRRPGFTLVEMLVSLALVLFIMVILSQALSTGLETFRQLKAIGDMEERLRMASTILRKDLTLDHFAGRRRLSDPSFWIQGPPRVGFFRIEQGRPSILEGFDGDGLFSYLAVTHRLHFSIKLRGSQRDDFLSATILPNLVLRPPGSPLTGPNTHTTFFNQPADSRYQDAPNTYNSQWAEVVYFLWPNGTSAGGTPLYSLHRRQRLAVPDNRELNWGNAIIKVANRNEWLLRFAQHSALSCTKADPTPNKYPNQVYFNNPTDLTVPERRFGMNTLPGSQGLPSDYRPLGKGLDDLPPAGMGDDLLLTDVISFTVRVLSPDLNSPGVSPLGDFMDLPPLKPPAPLAIFDTWSTFQDETYNYYGKNAPLPIRINALQINLRVFDVKTRQTRQVTIIQDM